MWSNYFDYSFGDAQARHEAMVEKYMKQSEYCCAMSPLYALRSFSDIWRQNQALSEPTDNLVPTKRHVAPASEGVNWAQDAKNSEARYS